MPPLILSRKASRTKRLPNLWAFPAFIQDRLVSAAFNVSFFKFYGGWFFRFFAAFLSAFSLAGRFFALSVSHLFPFPFVPLLASLSRYPLCVSRSPCGLTYLLNS